MKKNLLLTLVALLCVVHAHAYDYFRSEGICYDITSETTVAVTKLGFNGEKYSGTIIIPAEVSYSGIRYSVTSIDSWAFEGCTGLTSVTIPNSVTSIGDMAFWYCTGLTSITIGNSVTWIGVEAFGNTPWYNNQPDGVVYINNVLYAYKGAMPDNTSIVVKEGTVSISPYAFRNCTGLTSITIPNSVTSIGDDAFRDCTGLTSITIPNSVTSIGDMAFRNCTGLTSVVVESGNTMYDSRNNCNAIIETATNILIQGCKTTIIPNSVTSIDSWAFCDCTGLTSITIGNSVTSIGIEAFRSCTGLTSVTIPNSVTSIGSSAFNNVPNIVYYGTATGSPWGARSINGYVDGYLVYEDATKTKLLACSTAATGEITIPNSVTSIGVSAFRGCTGLTSITIPNSVTSIGDMAFRGCTGLTSIVVESGNTMYNSRNNCNAIIETATNTLIQGCKTTIIPNSVTSIRGWAFEGCTGLISVTIPNSVTSIGDGAFEGCTGLISVTIPNSVTSIGDGAFESCTGLTSITIPNSVTSIGNEAFSRCTGLTSITIPNSVTSIGDGAFSFCTGLTSITIPNSVTSIGVGTFGSCTGLTSVTIPNSVTSIGINAFNGCTNLTSVTIPNSVTSIDNWAFFSCTGLTSITSLAPIPPTTWKDAFRYVLTDIPVYVPCGSSDAYSMAEEWKSFTNYIEQLTAIVAITSQDENKGIVTITKQASSCEDNECTFVATANEHYHFTQWSDGNTDNPRTVSVVGDATYTAEFKPDSYTIIVSAGEHGTITGGGTYDYGTTATLTATANEHYHFTQWSDGNTDNPRTVAVEDNATYTAEFKPDSYTIIVSAGEHGSVNGGGTYDYGTTATLTAKANEHYHFIRWSDGNTDNPRTLMVEGNATYTAEFAIDQFTISATGEYGRIEGTGTYDYGTTATLTATADEHYHFTRWTDGNTDNPRTVSVESDATYTAEFAVNQYTITTYAQNGNVNGGGTYDYGTTATLTATADEHYHFTQWTDGNTDNPRTISVEGDAVYTAEFLLNEYTITVLYDNIKGYVSGGGTYVYGTQVRLEVSANSGYEFAQWSNGATYNPYLLTATADLTLEAQFVPATAVDNVSADGTTPQKIIHNGQVYILRNGKTYTTTGVEIK